MLGAHKGVLACLINNNNNNPVDGTKGVVMARVNHSSITTMETMDLANKEAHPKVVNLKVVMAMVTTKVVNKVVISNNPSKAMGMVNNNSKANLHRIIMAIHSRIMVMVNKVAISSNLEDKEHLIKDIIKAVHNNHQTKAMDSSKTLATKEHLPHNLVTWVTTHKRHLVTAHSVSTKVITKEDTTSLKQLEITSPPT